MQKIRRLHAGDTCVLASHNQGKYREISALLSPYPLTLKKMTSLPEIEETATSFSGNSQLKALSISRFSDYPALADDSGLSVYALDGAPGIYSARWAGENKDFNKAMQKIWHLWEKTDSKDPKATFICALTLAWPDGNHVSVEGKIEGCITWPARGENGFGYDPIFIPDGCTETFSEMPAREKQRWSHRKRAFTKLAQCCFPPVD